MREKAKPGKQIAICRAWCPDDARTGYPYSFQLWNGKVWRWLVCGCGYYGRSDRTQESALRQAEYMGVRGWVRWVWIKRWVRCPGRKQGAWRAVIDWERSTKPVFSPGGPPARCPQAKEKRKS